MTARSLAPLGLFGGTFDPVHYGHLRSASEVHRALRLEEVRLVPARDPPHRGVPSASAAHRCAMLELALREFPQLSLDTRELERTGKSYTVLTLEALRAEMPRRSLVLILGVDAFAGLPQWHRWESVLQRAHIAVVTRPGAELADALQGPLNPLWQDRLILDPLELETSPAGAIYALPVTPQPISATAIRTALAEGRPDAVMGLLPGAVLDYIELHHLYRPATDETSQAR